MHYKTVLFDVGDTLLRVPKPAPHYQRLLARLGRQLELAEVEQIVDQARQQMSGDRWVADDLTLNRQRAGQRRHQHVETITSLAGLSCTDQVRAAFFEIYVGTEFFSIFPDSAQTLSKLHVQGYTLGIVSNWEERLMELCAAHGIAQYFDFAVVSEIEGYSKPHPALFERALALAGTGPDQVVHVGDRMREDVEGAAALGIDAVLIDRSREAGEAAHSPTITSLHDLPDLIALGRVR